MVSTAQDGGGGGRGGLQPIVCRVRRRCVREHHALAGISSWGRNDGTNCFRPDLSVVFEASGNAILQAVSDERLDVDRARWRNENASGIPNPGGPQARVLPDRVAAPQPLAAPAAP